MVIANKDSTAKIFVVLNKTNIAKIVIISASNVKTGITIPLANTEVYLYIH